MLVKFANLLGEGKKRVKMNKENPAMRGKKGRDFINPMGNLMNTINAMGKMMGGPDKGRVG